MNFRLQLFNCTERLFEHCTLIRLLRFIRHVSSLIAGSLLLRQWQLRPIRPPSRRVFAGAGVLVVVAIGVI
ncbi:MAG: hypothetical protein AAF385_11455, partial [Pseudomonadota bacterium]